MSRIDIPTLEAAPAKARPILENVQKQLGFVPNLHRLMSLSPQVLTGWLGLMGALSTTLDAKTRDAIALATSEVNSCHYCLSAHSFVASTFAKVGDEEISRNRAGLSEDTKRQAAVQFAKKVVESRGNVSDADFSAVRAAGYGDAQIIEIVALTAQYSMTNLLNNVAQTDIDFPLVSAPENVTA